MDGPADRHQSSMNGSQGHSDLSRRRRLLILVICSMSLLIVGLDVTIVNVALPAIHRSFGASLSGLQWTIDAYTLTIASLLMLSGSTADRIGRRKVFQIGLVVFSAGSLLCALAPTLQLLIAARVLQAIGGSMLNPVAMSIIRNVFDDPRERAQAIGVWGGMIGLSMALGPIVGGALVDTLGWRWVFLVNVPVGLVAVALTALFVPESRAPRPRRLDPVGQALVIVALSSLTYAIIEGGARRLRLARDRRPVLPVAGLVRVPGVLRAAPPGAAARDALLQERPVLGRQRDRDLRVRRAGWLPVPEHPVPPGRPWPFAVPRRAVRAADGGDDARVRAAVRALRRPPRDTRAARGRAASR